MTDLEILASCIEEADHIQVPTRYVESIALPIANISSKLKVLYRAILANSEKAKEDESEKEETIPEEPGD